MNGMDDTINRLQSPVFYRKRCRPLLTEPFGLSVPQALKYKAIEDHLRLLQNPAIIFIFKLQSDAMKKLIAAGCCFMFLQNFSKVSTGNDSAEQKTAGQKVLIKAIAVIVNTEANKKLPPRRTFIASSEPPLPRNLNDTIFFF